MQFYKDFPEYTILVIHKKKQLYLSFIILIFYHFYPLSSLSFIILILNILILYPPHPLLSSSFTILLLYQPHLLSSRSFGILKFILIHQLYDPPHVYYPYHPHHPPGCVGWVRSGGNRTRDLFPRRFLESSGPEERTAHQAKF